MHICFLCHEYPPGKHGGIGTLTQTLGRALAARGHMVTVVGVYRIDRDVREDDEGVSVVRLAATRVPKMGFVLNGHRLRKELRRTNHELPIDIIEGSELGLAFLSNSLPAARVIRMHGGHHFFYVTLGQKPRAWRSWLERRSFACADHLCAVSRFVADTTGDLLKLGDRPVEILPNPVDTTHFRPTPEISEDEGLIVFVGTVCEKKGIRQLVQAMPQIVSAVPYAHLWIVGRDWRDPQTGQSFVARLRNMISSDMEPHIEFKGVVDNSRLPQTLAKAQVCAYPSHMESQGIANLEAMAMGKAVVSTQTGPGPELMEDGVSGLLCDPHDPASIAEKVVTLLKDAGLRRRMGQQARSRTVELFSVDTLVDRNERFYERCVREKPSE